MPSQAVTTFHPSENHTNTTYISIMYIDDEGQAQFLCQNSPHSGGHSVIVTAEGGIVDSKSKSHP